MSDDMTRTASRPVPPVYLVPCADYAQSDAALTALLEAAHGLDFVSPGMTVGIKANLVAAMRSDEAATTHPELLSSLTRLLFAHGAGRVIIGDSPGGVYTAAFVRHIYDQTGVTAATQYGAELNGNFSITETAYPEAAVLKSFTYTSWLDDCDALINFCKLKSHGMMGMSASAKNMFGTIPGTMKPEYHFRFPEMPDFSDMLIDIDEYFAPKVRLCLVDGVVGMEGNGPTKGSPKHIGVLLASASPHAVDYVNAHLIGLGAAEVPTLLAAQRRGLIPEALSDIEVIVPGADRGGDTAARLVPFRVSSFDHIAVRRSLVFTSKGKIPGWFCKVFLSSRPQLRKNECIGCGKCANTCPAKAITIQKDKTGKGRGKAVIDRDKCIRCFCCQEFCPVGAMKVHRTLIARLLTGKSTKK
ncbi:MAG: DUF362 domain-containing protein [Clostridia bacterium]|nr:DUF362 domain-containing protein [Clostridia bacterium]